MIMNAWNNNSKQREWLSKEQFAAVMKIARELETKENNLYFKSKIWYHNKKKIKQRPLWYSKTKQKKKKDEGVITRPVVSCQLDICEKLV